MPDIPHTPGWRPGLAAALADRYTIERELGRGGNATVYLAHDRKHKRKVALKVLLPELAQSVRTERFLHEIEIAAGLTHPHILPLHDSGEAQGFLYYVMPYVAGESLRERLTREGQLPVEDALKILHGILGLPRRTAVVWSRLALVYAGLGDKDQAFDALEQARRGGLRIGGGLRNALWDPLRSDPRFPAFLKALGQP